MLNNKIPIFSLKNETNHSFLAFFIGLLNHTTNIYYTIILCQDYDRGTRYIPDLKRLIVY